MKSALKNMSNGKSAGPDGILPEFLKNLGKEAQGVLLKFLNKTWNEQTPSQWRKATILPFLKKGKDPQTPSSYRPISLTSVLCKLVERIITNRLQIYIEKKKLLSHRQAGFRKRRCTVDQVLRLTQEVKDGFQRRQSTLAVFVDFSSAFDRVWRKKLLEKIKNIGIGGNLYHWIKSFLDQRFVKVRFNNVESRYRQIKQGLPQGSVLSPILFNLMIDDIISYISSAVPGVQGLMYADDLVLWATSSSIPATELAMNQAMEALARWSRENEMKVNIEKTCYQLFTLSTKSYSDLTVNYGSVTLPRTDKSTYLGVVLDTKLNWKNHIRKSEERGLSRLNLLKRLTGIRWGSNQDLLAMTYKTYVRPAMEYGRELLVTAAPSNLRSLDLVQNKALRVITGGAKSTPIQALELQASIEPLSDRREEASLILREKLFRRDDDYWLSYRSAGSRLKSQVTFLSKADELTETLGLSLDKRETFPEAFLNLNVADSNLELLYGINKKNAVNETELKQVSLATLEMLYPTPEWFRIFTDGSADRNLKIAGAGLYSEVFEDSFPLPSWADNYDAELKAIEAALQYAQTRPNKKFVLLIDCQAAILSLSKSLPTNNCTESSCRVLIDDMIKKGKKVTLQWMPGHSGIFGNEKADLLAKEGSKKLLNEEVKMPLRNAKKAISERLNDLRVSKYKQEGAGRKWEPLLLNSNRIPNHLPRPVGVACFRMLVGHDFLQKHLHRIGITENGMCPLCNTGEMTGEHLFNCIELSDVPRKGDKFTQMASLYWTARKKMTERSSL